MAEEGYTSLTSLFEHEIAVNEEIKQNSVSMIVDNQYAKAFLFAGNCHCSIENMKTGNRFSYTIQRDKKQNNMYYVNSITESGETYCGYFYENCGGIDYRQGKKGALGKDNIRIKALIYVLEHINYLNKNIIIEHDGRCACCGSTLEDTNSFKKGLCPMCCGV